MSSKTFWSAILFAPLAALVCVALLPRHRPWEHSLIHPIAAYACGGVMILTAWAICFRPQIERRRFSLLSLAALVAMEAALFGGMRCWDLRL
jgi:hypothetical protein